MKDLSFLNLITAIFGAGVSLFLLLNKNGNKKLNAILAFCFLTLSFRSINIYLVQNDLVRNTFIVGYVSFVYYWISPAFYFYFRQMSDDNRKFKKSDFIHLILPVIATLIPIVYLLMQWVKGEVIGLPTQKPDNFSELPFYLNTFYHAHILMFSGILYCIFSWRIILKNFSLNKIDHPQQKKIRKWLLTVIIICTILILVMSSMVLTNFDFKFDSTNIFRHNIIRSIIIIYLFTYIVYNSELLLGLPEIHHTKLPVIHSENTGYVQLIKQQEPKNEVETPQEPSLYDGNGWIMFQNKVKIEQLEPGIETDKAAKYIEQINLYMSEKPYLDEAFNMKQISNHLNVPHYHIEFLFRYYNRFAFTEFRNMLRVNYVIEQLENKKHKLTTVEDLGTQAGFSSRSSFFRVFKQITGKTPKQYTEED